MLPLRWTLVVTTACLASWTTVVVVVASDDAGTRRIAAAATTTTAVLPEDLHMAADASNEAVRIHNPSESFACRSPEESEALLAKFHANTTCNRLEFNSFKKELDRSVRYQYYKHRPDHHGLVPDEKTVACPAVIQNLYSDDQHIGYDSNWIVENQASTPIVLSYVDQEDGREYSAVSSRISPPQADPAAIVAPGQWKHVQTYHGHVFHARELLPNGDTGRVLLQYRSGLIPVGARMASQLTCTLDDPEPIVEVVKENNVRQLAITPAFQRSARKPLVDCHQLSIGFRNRAGCPLHGYYVRPSTCQEIFKLHLGMDPAPADFFWDWRSPTKFETSYVGNVFVFRLATHADGTPASGDSQVVERVEVGATVVTDCPGLRNQIAAGHLLAPEIALPVGMPQHSAAGGTNVSNATAWSTGWMSPKKQQRGSKQHLPGGIDLSIGASFSNATLVYAVPGVLSI